MATQWGMADSLNVYAEYRLTFIPQQPVLRIVWWGYAYGTADGGISIDGLLSRWRCDDIGYGPPGYWWGDQPYSVIVEP